MPPEHAADGDKPLVLLAQPLFLNLAAALEGRYRFVLAGEADAATAAEARVLLVPGLVPVPAELIDRFPALELVAATSVGLDHVDLAACRRRPGLAVTNAGAAFSVDTADYAVGLVVAVLRRVAAAEAHLRGGAWATEGKYPLTSKVSFFFFFDNYQERLVDLSMAFLTVFFFFLQLLCIHNSRPS